MATILRYIRPFVLIVSFLLSLGVYGFVVLAIPQESLQIAKLAQAYALISIIYLYFSLLVSPLYAVFPKLPFYGLILKARRATGVSAFYFSLLHALLAFFKQIGGIQGLLFLPANYLLAVMFGTLSLLILFLMAMTSNDRMVAFLTFRRWKFLHRFVYFAAIFILIHSLLIGPHFRDPGIISFFGYPLITFLIILEIIRLKRFLARKTPAAFSQ